VTTQLQLTIIIIIIIIIIITIIMWGRVGRTGFESGQQTAYHEWRSKWLFYFPLDKCWQSVLKQAAIFPSKTFPIYNSKASYHQKLFEKVDENLEINKSAMKIDSNDQSWNTNNLLLHHSLVLHSYYALSWPPFYVV